ncbi:MAG: TetR/AcrR family transcriptional regulator [Mycobacterium sp.]|nr:MAG: TetR/AcrR family transcriptional regulator [Mycobacterium sp.]
MPRSSDARDRLVATAARLFLERSYQAVGVDELCRATDIKKGSFYHYFPSKSELAKAVIDVHAKAFQRQLTSSPTATPAEKLHAIPDAIGAIQSALEAQFGRAVGCPFGNFAAELSTTDDDLREHLAHTLKTMEHHMAVIATEAAATGALRPGTDPQQLAHALLAQYQGIILLAKLNDAGVAHLAPALHDFIDGYLTRTQLDGGNLA